MSKSSILMLWLHALLHINPHIPNKSWHNYLLTFPHTFNKSFLFPCLHNLHISLLYLFSCSSITRAFYHHSRSNTPCLVMLNKIKKTQIIMFWIQYLNNITFAFDLTTYISVRYITFCRYEQNISIRAFCVLRAPGMSWSGAGKIAAMIELLSTISWAISCERKHL